jgi:hypothetical protein
MAMASSAREAGSDALDVVNGVLYVLQIARAAAPPGPKIS